MKRVVASAVLASRTSAQGALVEYSSSRRCPPKPALAATATPETPDLAAEA